jgi:hypothetical protein
MSFSMFSDTSAPPSPAKQFATIVHDGPESGIHTIAWCDTYSNLTRSLERRLLRELDLRVLFQMSGEDSINLIDTPAAKTIGPHRAILYSEETGRWEKFRPYSIPSADWLQKALSSIRQKSTLPTQLHSI